MKVGRRVEIDREIRRKRDTERAKDEDTFIQRTKIKVMTSRTSLSQYNIHLQVISVKTRNNIAAFLSTKWQVGAFHQTQPDDIENT